MGVGTATIDRAELYRLIVEHLRASAIGIEDAVIYSMAVAMADQTAPEGKAIQVVPGSWNLKYPKGGLDLRVERFRVYAWVRLSLDFDEQDHQRLTNASDGVLALLARVDEVLTQKRLGEVLVVDTMPTSGSSGTRDPSAPDYVGIWHEYQLEYAPPGHATVSDGERTTP